MADGFMTLSILKSSHIPGGELAGVRLKWDFWRIARKTDPVGIGVHLDLDCNREYGSVLLPDVLAVLKVMLD